MTDCTLFYYSYIDADAEKKMPVKGKKKKPHAAEGIVGKYIKKETPTVIPRCKFIDLTMIILFCMFDFTLTPAVMHRNSPFYFHSYM